MKKLLCSVFASVCLIASPAMAGNVVKSIDLNLTYNPVTKELTDEFDTVITEGTVFLDVMPEWEHNPTPTTEIRWGIVTKVFNPVHILNISSAEGNRFKVSTKFLQHNVGINHRYVGGRSTLHWTLRWLSDEGGCIGTTSVYGASETEPEINHQLVNPNAGWESSSSCTGKANRVRWNRTLNGATASPKDTRTNELRWAFKILDEDQILKPGVYTGTGQVVVTGWIIPQVGDAPYQQTATLNINYTIDVLPEYDRVEAPGSVSFSTNADQDDRAVDFIATVYGVFSEQMRLTATSANGSGGTFTMNCVECPTLYPAIPSIQDIDYDVSILPLGANYSKTNLVSGNTSTINLIRDSNGYYGGKGSARFQFTLEYDRAPVTKVGTDLTYSDALTLTFEPVI